MPSYIPVTYDGIKPERTPFTATKKMPFVNARSAAVQPGVSSQCQRRILSL
jgi:hypothetical protein